MPNYQKIEDHGEEEYRSETSITKLWRQTPENRNRSSGQESTGIVRRWRRKRYLLAVERNGQCSKGDQCSFRQERNDRAQKPETKATTPSEPSMTRGRSVSRKRSVRGRSQTEKFNRPPCKYFLKGTCTESPCEYWHPPACQFYKTRNGM